MPYLRALVYRESFIFQKASANNGAKCARARRRARVLEFCGNPGKPNRFSNRVSQRHITHSWLYNTSFKACLRALASSEGNHRLFVIVIPI
eukprot:4000957-Pyramimonas_sp.AAC.1